MLRGRHQAGMCECRLEFAAGLPREAGVGSVPGELFGGAVDGASKVPTSPERYRFLCHLHANGARVHADRTAIRIASRNILSNATHCRNNYHLSIEIRISIEKVSVQRYYALHDHAYSDGLTWAPPAGARPG